MDARARTVRRLVHVIGLSTHPHLSAMIAAWRLNNPTQHPSLSQAGLILLRFFNETSTLPLFTNLPLPGPSPPLGSVLKPSSHPWGKGLTMHRPILSF